MTTARRLSAPWRRAETKPYEPSVLIAHIEAKLRRWAPHGQKSYRAADLCLDVKTRSLTKGGRHVPLSQTEYKLLRYFMEHQGEFVSFDKAYSAIWQAPSLGCYRALYVHVSNLRRKIEDDPANPTLLKTYQRSGYIFNQAD